MDKKQLTVRELVCLLDACPSDMLVKVEGCDCVREAMGVETLDEENILIASY